MNPLREPRNTKSRALKTEENLAKVAIEDNIAAPRAEEDLISRSR